MLSLGVESTSGIAGSAGRVHTRAISSVLPLVVVTGSIGVEFPRIHFGLATMSNFI